MHFSYIDLEDGQERFISVPEQGGGSLIPDGRPNPGSLHTISIGDNGIPGVYRLEIQTMAQMTCGFGRTRETTTPGIYNVVFDYMEEKAGQYAARASVRIAEELISGMPVTEIAEKLKVDIQEMREIRESERLGPSTGCIVDEAVSRGIPYIRLNRHSLVQLGYGVNQRRIRATIASTTGSIAVDIACDKEETKNLLGAAEIPVPKGRIVYGEEGLKEAIADDAQWAIIVDEFDDLLRQQ